MTTENFDFTATFMGKTFEVTISKGDDMDTLLERLQDDFKTEYENENDGNEFDGDLEDSFDVSNWGDVPEFLQDLETLFDYLENVDVYEIEVYEAAHELDIPFADISEAYQGEFDSDEAFARNLADDLGYLNKSMSWPYTCIDWEQAASELMCDYSTANGHYFRDL